MILEDPEKDVFELLSHEARHFLFATPEFHNSGVKSLEKFEYEVPIDVKLVGFDGAGLELDPRDIERFFKHFSTRVPLSSIESTSHDGEHNLPISRHLVYHFTKSKSGLADKLEDAIVDFVEDEEQHSNVTLVPSSVVDEVITSDFKRHAFVNTIYILNLGLKEKIGKYAYSSDESDCIMALKPGIGSGNRFLWVDVSALRVSYGPIWGGGGVHNYTLPQIPDDNEDHPGDHRNEVIMDIASFVHETAVHLFARSLNHWPFARPQKETVFKFIVIHDHPIHTGERFGVLDPNTILEPLRQLKTSGVLIGEKEDINLAQDPLFASVYTNSLSWTTSSYRNRKGIQTETSSYLDSRKLHYWINQWESQNGQNGDNIKDGRRVIPIYLFDFSYNDVILLDRLNQAVAFPDMVIAIQTQTRSHLSDFYCSSFPLPFTPHNASRSILSAILQTAWGVCPTHEIWGVAQKAVQENWMWSLAGTPFGFGNTGHSLSFYLIDSGDVNVIFDELLDLQAEIQEIFFPFLKRKRELFDLLAPEDMLTFTQRWNFLISKLEKTKEYMSHHHFKNALLYLQSCRHDITILRLYTTKAKENIISTFSCDLSSPSSFRTGFDMSFLDWVGVLLGPCLTFVLTGYTAFRFCVAFAGVVLV